MAWRRRAEFLGARHPRGWLLGVTRRTLADERRAASRQSGLRARAGAVVAPRPHDPAALVTERAAIAAAFSRLRDADREVLALIAWDGLSPNEAAAALGCSRAAFAVRLHRARSRLAVQLRPHDADDPPEPRTSRVLAAPITAELFTAERNHS